MARFLRTINLKLWTNYRIIACKIAPKPLLCGFIQRYASRAVLSSLAFVPMVSALGFGMSKSRQDDIKSNPETIIITQADVLYSNHDVDGLYNYLRQYKETNNAEILWRLARATRDQAKTATELQQTRDLMYEAYEYIKKALAMDDNSFAVHKWYAIMLNYIGDFEGTKQKIQNAYKVKEHFQRASELNPNDATTIHLLGQWCYALADMSWYMHKLAATFYASPPTSTYAEALSYFEQAEAVDPNFYGTNLLYIGKCYIQLNKKDLARQYLERAVLFPVATVDDKETQIEAQSLLNSL